MGAKGEIIPFNAKMKSMKDWLESSSVQDDIGKAARSLDVRHIIRVATTAISRNPTLLECTRSSLFAALMQATELGLFVNGALGQAYMVPYRNGNVHEAQFQIGYKGCRDLAYRSGRVDWIYAESVYMNDRFKHRLGSEPQLIHEPCEGDRGDFRGAYAVAKLKDGGTVHKYMSRVEIEKHRDHYSRAARRDDSAWKTAFEAMAKKTVFLQLFHWLPSSIEMEKAVAIDERGESGLDSGDVIDIPATEPEQQSADDMADLTEKLGGQSSSDAEETKCSNLRAEIRAMLRTANLPGNDWDTMRSQVGADFKELEDMSGGQLEALKAKLEAASKAKKSK